VRPAGVHRPLVVGDIHHVGSNSVPSLPVKPVIDILVGVETLECSWPCKEKVASLGYLYWPYRSDVMHWLLKPDPARRMHHLYLVPVESCRLQDELAFRDASSTRSAWPGVTRLLSVISPLGSRTTAKPTTAQDALRVVTMADDVDSLGQRAGHSRWSGGWSCCHEDRGGCCSGALPNLARSSRGHCCW
jgi:hypothetical protein